MAGGALGTVIALLALVVGLGACSSNNDTGASEAPESTGSEFQQGSVPTDETRSSSGDASKLEKVYFDFDRADIRSEAKTALRTNADHLKGTTAGVTIEGHCDERGSEEYNLALGERRASAVRRYLADLGVPMGRLRIVSYGEAKPAVQGHDESAWRWNRNAAFRVN